MHEALNHAVKHNQDLAKLQDDIREQVDETIRQVFKDSMETLARTLLPALPQLQRLLLEGENHG